MFLARGAGQVSSSIEIKNPPIRNLEKTWREVESFEMQRTLYVTGGVALLAESNLVSTMFYTAQIKRQYNSLILLKFIPECTNLPR